MTDASFLGFRRTPALLALVISLALGGLVGPASAATPLRGSAGSTGVGRVGAAPAVAAAQPPGSLPGIDVSHWQNAIDWTQVAADGQRFVIAKATEGQNFDDPMYATYRAGATAAGLTFGAYHFARPDSTANDAILEADHFVSVAQLGAGNLIPVLDLEKTGGLPATELTAWALAWLGEVDARIGVRPMVYSGPNFWTTNMDDSTAIADAGYRLWIAHWGVASPSVPASDWSGHGWTFWQHTDCAHVPGIGGCVDHDWFNGTDFAPVTIRGLTVTLSPADGVVTSSPAGISCGATCSATFDPGAIVTLTATPNPGFELAGWGGACTGTGPCTVAMNGDRAVTATFGDAVPPTVTLATSADLGGTISATFSEVVHHVSLSNVVLRAAGQTTNVSAALSCRSRRGLGTNCANGNVLTATLQPSEPLVAGLAYSAIVAPPGSSASIVDVGGNAVPMTQQDFTTPTEVEQSSIGVGFGWRTQHNHGAYGHSYAVERTAGASVSFDFHGRKITWFTVTGPMHGKAEVAIDGRSRGSFDQYASATHFKVARSFSVASPGEHTITVTVLGRRGSRSATDDLVAVDAFAVAGKVISRPELGASWGDRRVSAASGGSIADSDLAGARASFAFAGTGVDWITSEGPDQGRANVFIDGRLVKTVDGYAPRPAFGVVRSFTGLAEGIHTIRIVAQGSARPAASGTSVSVDAFAVR
jgi:GH25 family lysozyme M1 (1,4-beta-N-acetylmuramidase)